MVSTSFFSNPLPLVAADKRVLTRTRNTPLCTLDQRKPLKKTAPRRHHRPSKDAIASHSSPSFKLLQPDAPKEDIPARPPAHWGIPIFGFILEHWLGVSPAQRAARYGGIYRSNILMEPMHMVTDYSTTGEILRHPAFFTSVGSFSAIEGVFGKDTMVLLDGADHAELRSTVAPAFKPALFPFFFPAIRDRAKKTWAGVEASVQQEGTVKLEPLFRKHYLSIIVEMTTGLDMDGELAPFALKNFWAMMKNFMAPPFGPVWDAGLKSRDEMVEFLKDLIATIVVEKGGVIDKLREYGDELTYSGSRDIADGEVNVMLIAIAKSGLKTGVGARNDPDEVDKLANLMNVLWFAGYATSAATTACAAFEMGMRGDVWDRLRAEQDAITNEAGGREVAYDQMQSMPLLDSFITEMLRLHPPISIRKVTSDMEVLGRHVRQGEKVLLDFPAAMRDPAVYDSPDTLRLDRFVRKEGKEDPPAVLAFGAPGSPHYCIGASLAKVMMKTTLAVLLRGWDMVLDPGQRRGYTIVPDKVPRSGIVVSRFERRRAD